MIEGNVCLVFLGRGMLSRASRGCIEVEMLIREYVEDLRIREDEFDERYYIAVEAEAAVVDVDVVERGIDLWRVIRDIVVVEMRIIEDQMSLVGTPACLDA